MGFVVRFNNLVLYQKTLSFDFISHLFSPENVFVVGQIFMKCKVSYIAITDSEKDIRELLQKMCCSNIGKENVTIIPLTRAALDAAQNAGLMYDHKIVEKFYTDGSKQCDNKTNFIVSKFVNLAGNNELRRSLITANLPRLYQITAQAFAIEWLISSASEKYPTATWLSLNPTTSPFIPVGPPPANNPVNSGLLRTIVRAKHQQIFVHSMSLRLNQYFSNLITILKSFRHLMGAIRRCEFYRTTIEISGEELKEQPTKNLSLFYLFGDLSRTFNLEALAKDCSDNALFIGGDARQHGILQKVRSRRVKNVKFGIIGNWHLLKTTFKMIRQISTLTSSLSKVEGEIYGSSPSLKVLGPFLSNPSVWEVEKLANNWVFFTSIFSDRRIQTLITSDVDTADARLAILAADVCGVRTISWPHGYYLYQRPIFYYLAGRIIVHGELEANLALSEGVEPRRVVIAGRSVTEMPPRSFLRSKIAVILSYSPNWKSVSEDWLERTLSKVVVALNKSRRSLILKLHPMAGDTRRWLNVDVCQGLEIDQSAWNDADFQELEAAIFVGNPSSSILSVAVKRNVPAVILPWSESDRVLFEKYAFSYQDPEKAVVTLLKATTSSPARQALLNDLSRFCDYVIEPEKDADHELVQALSTPTQLCDRENRLE